MLRRLAGHATVATANALWHGFQVINRRIPYKTFQPKWAPAPLQKSTERTKPTFGFPRQTDSLCPTCVKEARAKILSGKMSIDQLIAGNPGEIKADIIERDAASGVVQWARRSRIGDAGLGIQDLEDARARAAQSLHPDHRSRPAARRPRRERRDCPR